MVSWLVTSLNNEAPSYARKPGVAQLQSKVYRTYGNPITMVKVTHSLTD